MLDIIEDIKTDTNVSLLDFGCGTSSLYEYISENKLSHITYSGLDISDKFIQACRNKFAGNQYYRLDIIENHDTLPGFDYIIANGVFTEKLDLSFEEMWSFFTKVLEILFTKINKGLAFNVMSKHVDWERDDLFHVGLDKLAAFLTRKLSRNYVIRNDYGLYEYTTYLYK